MVSLYRKWRSGSFDDLVGQEHVVRTLRNAVRTGRVAHAYLFTGPRGTGKTSSARILAKAVNCLSPRDGNPCNECESCIATNEGRAVDVIEIDAASNTSVDNVRDLRERVMYATGGGRYKVYIVDEVHRLSGAAFDAFLKTLEEPPPHVIFVFASTEPHKVPPTIRSRCQRFDFRRIGAEDAVGRVTFVAEQEGIEIEPGAVRLLAQHARGSLRDALGLLDQVRAYGEGRIEEDDVRAALGLGDPLLLARLSEAMIVGDVAAGLSEASSFFEAGGEPHGLLRQLAEYWRAVLLAASGVPARSLTIDPALEEQVLRHAKQVTPGAAVGVLGALVGRDFSPRYDVAPALAFEVAFVAGSLALNDRGAPQPAVPGATPARAPVKEQPAAPPAEPVSQRAQEAPPAETPRASTPAGEPAPDSADGSWERIVAEMRTKSPSLQAVLRSGYLMKVENGEVTIGFLYDFHRNQFAEPKKRKLLEEVVASVLGASYRVNCVHVTKADVEAARGSAAVEDDDGFIEEAAERLRQYHARQLGNGTS